MKPLSKLSLFLSATKLAFINSRSTLFTIYVHVPLGLVSFLVLSWICELVIQQTPILFPAPVAAMGILFGFLGIIHAFAPQRYLDLVLRLVSPPADWTLRHMSIFFVPNFVLIPANKILAPKDIGIVAAWFAVSFILAWTVVILIHRAIEKLNTRRYKNNLLPHVSTTSSTIKDANFTQKQRITIILSKITIRRPAAVVVKSKAQVKHVESPNDSMACSPVSPSITLAPVSSSQDAPQTSTTIGTDLDTMRTNITRERAFSASTLITPAQNKSDNKEDGIKEDLDAWTAGELTRVSSPQPHNITNQSQEHQSEDRGEGNVAFEKEDLEAVVGADQAEFDEKTKLANKLEKHIFDCLPYFLLFISGIPVYFVVDENIADSNSLPAASLPLFLSVNVFAYLFSIKIIPAPWRKYFHPIVVTALFTFFTIWALGSIKRYSLQSILDSYSTSTTYIELFRPDRWNGPAPGAGDILSSLLHGGIVALALPMYRFRHDLRNNLVPILVTVVTMACLSLFLWPLIARVIGLSPGDALSFLPRFVSTPLAIELAGAIDANQNLTVPLVVVTGIVTVIVKDRLFAIFRVQDDDYLAIGLTVGAIAGAIGTSSLNGVKPRAMAIATVTFVLFGTVLLILIAISPVAQFVKDLGALKIGAAAFS